MEKYIKASVVSLWVYLVISTAVTWPEYFNIQNGQGLYLVTKVVLQLSLLGLCFWFKKDPLGMLPNLCVGIHVILSNIHGQYFSPWYIFSYAEMIIAYSFLFPLPKRHFNWLVSLGTLAFIAMALYRYQVISERLYMSSPSDLISSVISAAAVAWLSHNFFTKDRTQREDLIRRFGILGVQTANVVHDAKSMLAAPRMNVDLLKRKIRLGEKDELPGIIENLERQLNAVAHSMSGLHGLSSLQSRDSETFEFREMLNEVIQASSFSLQQVRVEVDGNTRLLTQRSVLESVFFNVIMNSLQAFKKNKTDDPCLRISCDHRKMSVMDNGGGFSKDVLAALKHKSFDASQGLGMGTFLIWNGIESLGGRVEFANFENGARVEIYLPSLGL